MKVFFTADTHWGHANIIKYTNRPFKNVNEMDEVLINNWNAKVGKDDLVYHLGDFCFGRENATFEKYFRRLNGLISFIEGNHDKLAKANKHRFWAYNKYKEIEIEGQEITLLHYALRVWNKSHHGSFHLFGHSHGTLPDDPDSRSIDVGVDCHNFTPISFEEVKIIMAKKTFKPIDHHGRD